MCDNLGAGNEALELRTQQIGSSSNIRIDKTATNSQIFLVRTVLYVNPSILTCLQIKATVSYRNVAQ
jgi:hypothetical protein